MINDFYISKLDMLSAEVSSDADIVSAGINGYVAAIRPGESTVSFSSEDGTIAGTCLVSATARTDVAFYGTLLTMDEGADIDMLALAGLLDSGYAEILWSSDNSLIAGIDTSGIVTANVEGETELHAASNDGTYSGSWTVAVYGSSTFTTVWHSSVIGSTDSTIRLPLTETGTYNFTVDWGDGSRDTITAWNDPAKTHTYSENGTYTVHITGTITGWQFFMDGDSHPLQKYELWAGEAGWYPSFGYARKLYDIENWGCLAFGETMGQFTGCMNLSITAEDQPDLSGTSCLYGAFHLYDGSGIPGIDNWDVSQVNDLSYMFCEANNFNQDLNSWVTDNVTDMSYMFCSDVMYGHSDYNGDISGWNTANVLNMSHTFCAATSFNRDISGWDTSSVTDMSMMFGYGITDSMDHTMGIPDEYTPSFNQDISGWDVSSVENMNGMFYGAESFNQDLNTWQTGNVMNMNSMFSHAVSFNGDISSWNTSNVADMGGMFYDAQIFNCNIGLWDTSQATNMSYMFAYAEVFNQDLSAWETGNVTSMVMMFGYYDIWADMMGYPQDNDIMAFDRNLAGWDITAVEDGGDMFLGATLTTANYSEMLISWAAQTPQSNVDFGGGGSMYNVSAASARQTLIDTFSWTIEDGGPE